MRKLIAIQTDKDGKDIPGSERVFNYDHWLRMLTMRVVRWRKVKDVKPVIPKIVVAESESEKDEDKVIESEDYKPRRKTKKKQIKDKEL